MYKLVKEQTTNKISVVQKQEGNVLFSIPFDPANTDYQQYLAWLEAGNTPLPADEPTA